MNTIDIIRQMLGGGGVNPDHMSQTFRRLNVSMTDDDALDIAKEIAAALEASADG